MKSLVAVLALTLTACAVTPEIEEREPLGQNLSRYRAIYAAIEADPEVQAKDNYLAASGRLLGEFVGDLGALGKSAAIGRAPQGERALEARLNVTDFNYVGGAARMLGGILVGHATLAVTMTLTDSASRSVVGVVSASDTSNHLQGVFGADTDRQVEAIAKELASKLQGVGAGGGAATSIGYAPSAASSNGSPGVVKLEELQHLGAAPDKRPLALSGMRDNAGRPDPVLDASQFFESVSPSVWGLRALDAERRPLASGTAVAIAPQQVVTTCHLLVGASTVEIRRGNETRGGQLEYADAQRNLCVLAVDGLAAPPVRVARMGSVKVGQRAYAITFAEKLGASLEQGLVSSVQADDAALPPLRVAMPLAADANGGGVFDEHGRLIGITTLNAPRAGLAPQVTFVLPAQWIAEVPERSRKQLAMLPRPTAVSFGAKPGVLPAPGSQWSYTVHDRGFSDAKWNFSVVLNGVNGSAVTETVSTSSGQQPYGLDAKTMAFIVRPMKPDSVFELSPYLLAYTPAPALPLRGPSAYATGAGVGWEIRVAQVVREPISLAAGKFDAVRLKVIGENPNVVMLSGNHNKPQRFEYTIWYAPEVGRYVQARHQVFDVYGTSYSDQWVRLVSYQPGGAPRKP